MKVTFVVPPYDFSKAVRNIRRNSRVGILPPLGVGFLAACLEARGHSTHLVDAMAECLDVPRAAKAVANRKPDVVGISVLATLNAQVAFALARELKSLLPDVPLVMGGPHVTLFPGETLEQCTDVDVIVMGDGEVVFPDLVERLGDDRPYDDLPSLGYRDAAGEVVLRGPRRRAR